MIQKKKNKNLYKYDKLFNNEGVFMKFLTRCLFIIFAGDFWSGDL